MDGKTKGEAEGIYLCVGKRLFYCGARTTIKE